MPDSTSMRPGRAADDTDEVDTDDTDEVDTDDTDEVDTDDTDEVDTDETGVERIDDTDTDGTDTDVTDTDGTDTDDTGTGWTDTDRADQYDQRGTETMTHVAGARRGARVSLIAAGRTRLWSNAGIVLIVLVALATGWMARQLHEGGHDWGDDFALYIRQAQALSDGGVETVYTDTRFAVEESGWDFSPHIYPWGFPLLIAPVLALRGIDYDALKLVEVASLVVALAMLGLIIRRRLGMVAALLGLGFLAMSQMLLGATGSVLSDVPYLAWIMVTFGCIDWCRSSGAFLGARTKPLVATGLAAAMAFSTRREGLLVLIAGLAAQAIEVAVSARTQTAGQAGRTRALVTWFRALPWRSLHQMVSSFVAVVVAIQLLLPGKLGATYDATSSDARTNWFWFRKILAEYIGVKLIGDFPIALGDSERIGRAMLTMFVCAAVVGMFVCLFGSLRRDVHLIVYGVLHVALLARLPFREARYVMVPVFLCVYFVLALVPGALRLARTRSSPPAIGAAFAVMAIGLVGVAGFPPVIPTMAAMYGVCVLLPMAAGTLVALRPGGSARTPRHRADPRASWRRTGASVLALTPAAALLLPMAQANGDRLHHAIDYHRVYDYELQGPTTPAAIEMIAQVRSITRADDVVAYFRARSMMLYTNRRSIQNADLRRVAAKADWYVMTRNPDGTPGTYAQYPLTDAEANRLGFVKVFENPEFAIFRTPGRAATPVIDPAPV